MGKDLLISSHFASADYASFCLRSGGVLFEITRTEDGGIRVGAGGMPLCFDDLPQFLAALNSLRKPEEPGNPMDGQEA
jgi:hypothetical protein